MVTGFPTTGRIFGRQTDVAHPRPGSFGSHGHRIDFCESTVLNHDPVIVPQSAKNLNRKKVKYCDLTDTQVDIQNRIPRQRVSDRCLTSHVIIFHFSGMTELVVYYESIKRGKEKTYI